MKEQKKYRGKNWYWGNWATKLRDGYYKDDRGHSMQLSDSDMEVYNEQEHGWHNSEEYKNGRKEKYDAK